MSYCDLCHCYDDEHTDGEPDMQKGRYYKPTREFFYSKEVVGKKYCAYDWGNIKSTKGYEVTCLCEHCFKSYDRLGKIKWKEKNVL